MATQGAGRSATIVGLGALAVVAWWLVGFLPWVVGGFRWPGGAPPSGGSAGGLQNLWLALPLVTAYLPVLVCCALIGAVAAGLLPMLVTHVGRTLALVEVWLVTVVTSLVLLGVSAREITTANNTSFAADNRVLQGLALVVFGVSLFGLVVASLCVRWYAFTAVGAALVAGCLPTWVSAFDAGVKRTAESGAASGAASNILVALVLLAGFVVSVRRGASAMWLWPVAVAVLWCVPPALVAVSRLAVLLHPGSGLPNELTDHLAAARQVFEKTLLHVHPDVWPVVAALVLGLAYALLWPRLRTEPAT